MRQLRVVIFLNDEQCYLKLEKINEEWKTNESELQKKVLKVKVYKVELIIDTGYEIFCKICILYAQDKENAKEKAYKYINSHLHGETFADVKNVTEIHINENVYIVIMHKKSSHFSMTRPADTI